MTFRSTLLSSRVEVSRTQCRIAIGHRRVDEGAMWWGVASQRIEEIEIEIQEISIRFQFDFNFCVENFSRTFNAPKIRLMAMRPIIHACRRVFVTGVKIRDNKTSEDYNQSNQRVVICSMTYPSFSMSWKQTNDERCWLFDANVTRSKEGFKWRLLKCCSIFIFSFVV